VALTHAAKQAVYTRSLLAPLELDATSPLVIKCDNQSAIAIAISAQGSFQPRLKHFDVKVHFIRAAIHGREVAVTYCPTGDMLADYLTKSLPRPAFHYLRGASGLHSSTNAASSFTASS
jgi:hypothetical protein